MRKKRNVYMDYPLISVIVPVYKVEQYLKQCVDSIIQQTYTNLEIILVDDGSPDSCPAICDEYAEKDRRILVIHKENGGVSEARNVGIDKSTGEYITFIDSDDYIAENYIEFLYNNMNGQMISECGMFEYYDKDDRCVCRYEKKEPIILNWKKYLTERGLKGFLSYAVVCSKLYNKSLFNSVRFPKGCKNGEDEATIIKLAYFSGGISRSYEPLYYYRQRENGASKQSINKDRINDVEFVFSEKISFLISQGQQDLVDFFRIKEAIYLTGCSRRVLDEELRDYCEKRVVELAKTSLFGANVPLRYKLSVVRGILWMTLRSKHHKHI